MVGMPHRLGNGRDKEMGVFCDLPAGRRARSGVEILVRVRGVGYYLRPAVRRVECEHDGTHVLCSATLPAGGPAGVQRHHAWGVRELLCTLRGRTSMAGTRVLCSSTTA